MRHPLTDHLRDTADRAVTFAGPLRADQLARAAGLLHDAGKASPQFQEYLARCEAGDPTAVRGPDHKGAGSVLAAQKGLELLVPLIQGHHGGLRDRADTRSWLEERRSDPLVESTIRNLPPTVAALLDFEPPATPDIGPAEAEMLLRMTFSALVDADFLDTEAHFQSAKSALRGAPIGSLTELRDAFVADQAHLTAKSPVTRVNLLREEGLNAALESAINPPGLFRLSLPTGCGKTRIAISFALEHAIRHDLRRVVVALPYTSITEQTADVYQAIFGEDAVLEHHSGIDTDAQDGNPAQRLWRRLACENWDAPIVVTTTVQLLESLFANGTSRCRKLHNLARAVVVIDEAQALPTRLLAPIIGALELLCSRFGSTVVLSTATQPAGDVPELSWLTGARQIVPESERFFDALRRVRWTWSSDTWTSERVAAEMLNRPQAMVVVNTRRSALSILDHLPSALHLSTLLCGAHRRQVLGRVRRLLADGESCHMVSTQVIEAGVDVDFPTVLRELAPLDSIVQAGGRCNREGKLDRGDVIIFAPADQQLPPDYRTGTDITQVMLTSGPVDFDDPESASTYFRDLYRYKDLDVSRIRDRQLALAYETVAREFKMIPEVTESVVVPYDDVANALVAELQQLTESAVGLGEGRDLLRRLQPYAVGLYPRDLERARREGWVVDLIVPVWSGPYDPVRGVGPLLELGYAGGGS